MKGKGSSDVPDINIFISCNLVGYFLKFNLLAIQIVFSFLAYSKVLRRIFITDIMKNVNFHVGQNSQIWFPGLFLYITSFLSNNVASFPFLFWRLRCKLLVE